MGAWRRGDPKGDHARPGAGRTRSARHEAGLEAARSNAGSPAWRRTRRPRRRHPERPPGPRSPHTARPLRAPSPASRHGRRRDRAATPASGSSPHASRRGGRRIRIARWRPARRTRTRRAVQRRANHGTPTRLTRGARLRLRSLGWLPWPNTVLGSATQRDGDGKESLSGAAPPIIRSARQPARAWTARRPRERAAR